MNFPANFARLVPFLSDIDLLPFQKKLFVFNYRHRALNFGLSSERVNKYPYLIVSCG